MSEELSGIEGQGATHEHGVSSGVIITVGLFILSLTLFLSPFLSYIVVVLAAIAVMVKAPAGKTLKYVLLGMTSIVLAMTSAVLSMIAVMLPAKELLLVSLILGFPSPIPLLLPIFDILGIGREVRAALAVALLAAGVITLPLYGTAPLHLQDSSTTESVSSVVENVGFLGLYIAIGYAPSSTAIIVGYLILIYVVMSGLRAYLQRMT